MRETFDLVSTLQIQAQGGEHIFEGMASVFGAPVQAWTPTKIDKGAFSRTLREAGNRVVLLNQHRVEEPIGKPVELREVENGLYLKGRISKTKIGEDVWALMRDGVLDGLSIGFNPISTYNETIDGETWRHISDLDLMEISLVTFPGDQAARVTATHGVQMAPSQDERLAQIREMRAIIERYKAEDLPSFGQKFGAGWIF